MESQNSSFNVLGTTQLYPHVKTVDEMINIIIYSECSISDRAVEMIYRPRFQEALRRTHNNKSHSKLGVCCTTVNNLTTKKKLPFIEIGYNIGKKFGGFICPEWLAPILAICYKDQPFGNRLYTLMNPIMVQARTLCIFSIANNKDTGRHLVTESCLPARSWFSDAKWIFLRQTP